MANTYYWIKLYFDLLDDWKVGNLPDSLKWRFIQCLLVAGETGQDGYLPKLDEMAFRIRPITPESLNDDLSRLARPGLVELRVHPDGDERWFVTKFEDRQGRISNAERQRSWRARKAGDTGESNDGVTDELQGSNEGVTGRYEEERREEENREDKEKIKREPLTLPPNLDTPQFHHVWKQWRQYKGGSIKALTYEKQLERASQECNLHGVTAVCGVFEATMSNGWKGLFWEKIGNGNGRMPAKQLQPVKGEF